MPKHNEEKKTKPKGKRVYREPIYFKSIRKLAKKHNLPIPHDDTAPIFDQAIDHLLNGTIKHVKLVMGDFSKVTPRIVRLGMLDFFRELDAKEEMDQLVVSSGHNAYTKIKNAQ